MARVFAFVPVLSLSVCPREYLKQKGLSQCSIYRTVASGGVKHVPLVSVPVNSFIPYLNELNMVNVTHFVYFCHLWLGKAMLNIFNFERSIVVTYCNDSKLEY